MELGNFTSAAAAYQTGASTHPNKQFSPQYLMKAALAFENAGDPNKAISTYDEVINKYPESLEITNARKFKARLEALAAN
jgi:TolA-binding protein